MRIQFNYIELYRYSAQVGRGIGEDGRSCVGKRFDEVGRSQQFTALMSKHMLVSDKPRLPFKFTCTLLYRLSY